MIKSDLVTYGGGTERYLFFSVAIKIVISKQSFPTLYLIKCQNKCLLSLLAQHNDHMDLTRYPICLGLLPVESNLESYPTGMMNFLQQFDAGLHTEKDIDINIVNLTSF